MAAPPRELTENPHDTGTLGYALADMLRITLSNIIFINVGTQTDMKAITNVRLSVCAWSKVAPSGP